MRPDAGTETPLRRDCGAVARLRGARGRDGAGPGSGRAFQAQAQGSALQGQGPAGSPPRGRGLGRPRCPSDLSKHPGAGDPRDTWQRSLACPAWEWGMRGPWVPGPAAVGSGPAVDAATGSRAGPESLSQPAPVRHSLGLEASEPTAGACPAVTRGSSSETLPGPRDRTPARSAAGSAAEPGGLGVGTLRAGAGCAWDTSVTFVVCLQRAGRRGEVGHGCAPGTGDSQQSLEERTVASG